MILEMVTAILGEVASLLLLNSKSFWIHRKLLKTYRKTNLFQKVFLCWTFSLEIWQTDIYAFQKGIVHNLEPFHHREDISRIEAKILK
jgi:hypothetical protein